jgi:hypothetical protein
MKNMTCNQNCNQGRNCNCVPKVVDPIEIADELHTLLNARMPNGSFVVKKQHRETVIYAEMILRKFFK